MSINKLAVIAGRLHGDLNAIGFGTCPTCEGRTTECAECGGEDREVNGAHLVDVMQRYFEELDRAVNAALGRGTIRQEALPLN